MLRDDQIRRYARHVLLPDVGGVGQERLLAATVMIDPRDPASRIAFDYLVAAGVGTIAIPVRDDALIARAAALNPDVRVIVDPLIQSVGLAQASPESRDPWIDAGVAATMLLYRLATGS